MNEHIKTDGESSNEYPATPRSEVETVTLSADRMIKSSAHTLAGIATIIVLGTLAWSDVHSKMQDHTDQIKDITTQLHQIRDALVSHHVIGPDALAANKTKETP